MLTVWLGKTKRIERLGLDLAVLVTIVMLFLFMLNPYLLVRLEDTSLDARFVLRGPRPAGHDVKLVLVDEPSIRELGRWPWSRDKHARLMEALREDGAKVVGFDVIFSESGVTEYLKELREISQAAGLEKKASSELQAILRSKMEAADTDAQFAQSLRRAGNVVLALPLIVPVENIVTTKPRFPEAPEFIREAQFMLVRESRSGEALEPYQATDAIPPLKHFADAAVSLGHVFSIPDLDGITRHEYLAIRYGTEQEYYPSFGLEVARLYLGVPRDRMSLILGVGVHLGDVLIPADQKARMLIDHIGPEDSLSRVSATDVIHRRFPPGTFTGKAVLIGASALGTYDQKAIPFSANFPGVEKNATVVENILHRRFLHRSVWAAPTDFGLILLFGLGFGTALTRMRALQGTVLMVSVTVGYIVLAQYLFVAHGLWIGVVYPLLTVGLVFTSVTVLKFMTEEKQAKEIRAMFSSYVSPRIVSELIKDPEKARLGGRRKELTMLFSDVVGFTTFSEQRTAEEVVSQLNEYLGAMTDVVFQWNGTLDKFVGDAVVVFWGAPLDQPDHAELAIKCALHMRARLEELQAKWRAEGKVPLDNGIGINTGEALVGNMGAEGKKMDYTMIGDHVNLAARVEGLTRKFKAPIVITEYTLESIKPILATEGNPDSRGRLGHVLIQGLGSVQVKGKDRPVVVYSLRTLAHNEPSRIVESESLAPQEIGSEH
jgi:adenylate cyclase